MRDDADLAAVARSMFHMPTPRAAVVLEDMIGDELDGSALHRLFALCRDHLQHLVGDPRRAIYAPPSVTGPRVRGFPLHSDFYLPALLLNIFDDVPADGSSVALLLPVAKLRTLLRAAPPLARSRLLACYGNSGTSDLFEVAYSALHRTPSMQRIYREQVAPAAIRLPLVRGAGYLLNDRAWMHGREAPVGGVRVDRLHRLVFDNLTLTRARTEA